MNKAIFHGLIDIIDRFGRKFNLYVFGSLLVVAGAIQAGSINSGMFVASRVLVGIACGALFTSVPIYQSEVAPAHLRGAMIACHGTVSRIRYRWPTYSDI